MMKRVLDTKGEADVSMYVEKEDTVG